ncbi:iron transporter [Uliginosibacterium gangwonense]|uniref:iron transporter n=1 Tax=Uliginosibacterium gangwonense TaxID=392736 RepID=UPI0003744D48|nr:iron transporter [Uliginosibacterium gangwonense]
MFKPSFRQITSVCVLSAALAGFAAPADAVEYPIGKPQQMAGMHIGAVYLQPVVMEPEGMMRDAKDSDVHLEADISALASNVNGFPEGSWVPYLVVGYELTKKGSPDVVKGDMMPMVANDGPHYGDNVKLSGPGQYHLKLTIAPPSANMHNHFGRHVDRQTGVGPWFKPFIAEYDFTFAGIGKKGGY